MGNEEGVCIVRTTVAKESDAVQLARAIVESRLAACVQSVPIRSVYRWKGRVEDEPEILLLAKTTRARSSALVDYIRGTHPYEVPEIIVTPVDDGLPAYLQWVSDETTPEP